jgi:hypothetical protein
MLNAVRFWILLSTTLVGGGWILSALHQLNQAGYVVILAPLALVVSLWCKKSRPLSREKRLRIRVKFFRRFKWRAPQFFLAIAALSFLSGCLYPALNYDANAYRLPRVMHWLWAEQWHWIHTFDSRMNISACGMEWLSTPLILFSHTDRFLFLINWVSYLMLPGLIFSVFTRLQVRPRVAWWWMWLLSSGWCFALQAGSIANDSFAAIYILAAVDLALRAREKNSVTDLWLSLLAVALATGTKQTNIPLVLLWLIAAWPSVRLLWLRPVGTLIVAGAGLLVSIVPVSILNYQHYGTWMPLNSAGVVRLGEFHLNPFWGIVGNLFCIPMQNLVPPFYELIPPFYSYWLSAWNELMRDFLHTSFGAHFSSFENFGHLSGTYYHGIAEGNAGLGLGICLLIFTAFREIRRREKSAPVETAVKSVLWLRILRLAPWGLLLVFMAKVGTFENARHLAPYYAFLFPALLVKSAQSFVVRQREWQRLGLVVMGFTVALVIASGDRPLFPAKTILAALREKFPDNEFISDECGRYVDGGYRITRARRDYLQAALPPGESKIGYYALMYDVDEPGIWLPFGRRSVVSISPNDSPDYLRAQGIKYLVTYGDVLPQENLDRWLKQYDATLAGRYTFPRPGIKTPSSDLYLIRLN